MVMLLSTHRFAAAVAVLAVTDGLFRLLRIETPFYAVRTRFAFLNSLTCTVSSVQTHFDVLFD